jgi:16S rRNA (uracil1498-N3)-methyltransferase
MHRFYIDPTRPDCLTPEDAHHACRVLRLREGDNIEVVLNEKKYTASLTCAVPDHTTFSLLQECPSSEPALKITLFQGLPKSDKMDWIIQKSVELGVHAVVPVIMQRSISRPDASDLAKKTDRWRRIAREAGKQSGRCCLPEISVPVSVPALKPLLSAHEKVIIPWENCSYGGPGSIFRAFPDCKSMAVVIGPEGGITDEEISVMTSWGCIPITLGRRILRTETAGLAAISAFMALYGEME